MSKPHPCAICDAPVASLYAALCRQCYHRSRHRTYRCVDCGAIVRQKRIVRCWTCAINRRIGQHGNHFRGGRHLSQDYVKVLVDLYHYQYEHRLMWEQAYGLIPRGHVVHHLNGDRQDNRLCNLTILPIGAHVRLHCGQKQGRKDA